MNKARPSVGERRTLELWRLVLPMPKTLPGQELVRRPLKSLRKIQASGMPFLPVSRG